VQNKNFTIFFTGISFYIALQAASAKDFKELIAETQY